jgi:hypothetical protein
MLTKRKKIVSSSQKCPKKEAKALSVMAQIEKEVGGA